MPGGILPGLTPELKAELFQAFDLQVLWNKPGQQATVFAEITEATLQALPGILDPAGTDTMTLPDIDSENPRTMEYLFESPMVAQILRRSRILHQNPPGEAETDKAGQMVHAAPMPHPAQLT